MKFSPTVIALILGAGSALVLADEAENPKAGHSSHGEGFSEGPRRFAKLLGGTGEVNFPVTTKSEEAQKFFNQGVGQLHGFWYFEAERTFRQVLFLDPDCVMGYWGAAMANVENDGRGRTIIADAVKRIDKANEKEKLWIRSLEKYYKEKKGDGEKKDAARQLVRDWEEIASKWPDDIEAKAFVAYQTWRNGYKNGIEVGSHLSVASLMELVFQKNPMHPAHHYAIHLWDNEKAERALFSAARCGQSAPNIAHMWHMPGHIYSDLERWTDAAWQQEAATRVDHRMMAAGGAMPDQIHNYAHNSEWMIRNFNHLGRAREAIIVAKNMVEEPRIPRSSSVKDTPDQKWDESGTAYALGRQRLVETLLRFELWDTVVALAQTPYLEPGDRFDDRIKRDQLVALAQFARGDTAAGREALKQLDARLTSVKQERAAAADAAETEARKAKKNADEINKAMADAMLPHTKKAEQAAKLLDEVRLWDALADRKTEEAQKIRDILRDVPKDRLARIDFKLGKTDEALKAAKEFAEKNKTQVQPVAAYADLLAAAGKMDEAKKEFERLRGIAGSSDLDLPVLERLKPVAAACGITGDWRLPGAVAKDTGERPDLNTLGPLLWRPAQAPHWQLQAADGRSVSSDEYLGKPYILIFFLGKGCPHCIQQLHAFEPKHAEFEKAGLPILTVSTDSSAGVQETVKLGKLDGGFPFPILTDIGLHTFRAFDAFDDFENCPLHGTLLIDAGGNVRWRHISYEPYMRADFLLEEAQRLLRMDRGTRGSVAEK